MLLQVHNKAGVRLQSLELIVLKKADNIPVSQFNLSAKFYFNN